MNRIKFGIVAVFMLAISLSSFLGTGCSKAESKAESVVPTHNEAFGFLENNQIDEAIDAYKKIVEDDPRDPTANVVLGILELTTVIGNDITQDVIHDLEAQFGGDFGLPTSFQEIIQNEGDSDSANHISSVQSVVVQSAVKAVVSSFDVDNTISLIPEAAQTIIEGVLIPTLESSLHYFETVLSLDSFQFKFTDEHNDKTIEIDKGDIHGIAAAINLLSSFLHQMVVYNVKVAAGNYASTEEMLANNPQFATLRSNGVAHSIAFLEGLRGFVSHSRDMLTSVQSETDDQTDDLFKKEDLPEDMDAVLSGLDEASSVLTGQRTVTVNYYFDGQNKSAEVTIDIPGYFSNPISDIRDYMGVYVTAPRAPNSWDFPSGFDFTLSGLFPDMDTFQKWDDVDFLDLIFIFYYTSNPF